MPKNKCSLEGHPEQILVNAFCIDCDTHHPQWKFPCVCEDGKVPVEPIGYRLCHLCMGRHYLNEKLKTYEKS